MAAPKRNASKPDDPRQAATRAAIKTTQLVNRLQGFALGEVDGKTGDPIDLSSERIRSIEILLRKALPDLQSVDVNTTGAITITIGPEAKRL